MIFPTRISPPIWGVSDEEVFARAIKEFHALNETGKPFLGTVMSVSNHKPYMYPAGAHPGKSGRNENPKHKPGIWRGFMIKLGVFDKPGATRNKAVKYSDWCLGQFFEAAKKEPFWTNTVFVVVADHGARVYGSQSIPIFSYEIPLVILGPAVVKSPTRIGQLGCSLDVAPTVLGSDWPPLRKHVFRPRPPERTTHRRPRLHQSQPRHRRHGTPAPGRFGIAENGGILFRRPESREHGTAHRPEQNPTKKSKPTPSPCIRSPTISTCTTDTASTPALSTGIRTPVARTNAPATK